MMYDKKELDEILKVAQVKKVKELNQADKNRANEMLLKMLSSIADTSVSKIVIGRKHNCE